KVCLEGTRVQIIAKISQWLLTTKDDAPQMFLLCGAAGTGKSAISHAIGKRFKEKKINYLGAFFTFDRTFAAEWTPVRAVQTIAYDLGKQIPDFGRALIRILEEDPDILRDSSLEEQWKKLILAPAQDVNESRPVVIILDALDESGNQKQLNSSSKKLISLLLNGNHGLPKNFRIFMTSRPEHDILKHVDDRSNYLHIEHMDNLKDTTEDISKYVLDCITKAKIIKQINESQCKLLAEKAEGYFQWAFTVCSELCRDEAGVKPKKLFQQFMGVAPHSKQSKHPLDETYRFILQHRINHLNKGLMEDYRKVMSQVLASHEPLSQQSLQKLQSACYRQRDNDHETDDEDETEVNEVIKYLGSLFTGAHELDTPVRPVHTSVRDFLLDNERSREYTVDLLQGHTIMTLGTIGLMTEELHFNMCKLETSHVFNSKVKDLPEKIEKCLSLELRYACCHWDFHLYKIKSTDSITSLLGKFICTEFSLYWIETLSILNRVNVISRSINNLMKWIEMMEKDLKTVGQELTSFIFVFGKILSQSTPHIYLSTLPFIAKSSRLQDIYVSQFTNRVKVCYGHRNKWPYLQAILQKHTRTVHSVAFSPDGKKIVSGSKDKTLRIWDAETGEPQGKPLKGHIGAVNSVAFSPDGRRIVSGSEDKLVWIWDTETGEPQGQPLQGHTDGVNSVAFSPDGRKVVSGSDDKSIRIWDAETGKPEGQPLQSWALSVAFSPDGKKIVSGSYDMSVQIWNVETREPQGQPLQGHTEAVMSVAFSPDGRRIASGSYDNSVRIWDAETGELVEQPLQGHTDSVNSVAFSPDGKRIISGSSDQSVWIWNVATGEPQGKPLKGHINLVNSVAFSPNGKRIVSGSVDKSVRIWDAETGESQGQLLLEGHTSWVFSVAFSPDGKRILSGSLDKSIQIWDAETGEQQRQPLQGHTGDVNSVAFSPDGTRIVSGSSDMSVWIWDAETGIPQGQPLQGHTESVRSVVFSPDGKKVISGSDDKLVWIWDVETGDPQGWPLQGHTDSVNSIAVSPDGKKIVSGSDDKSVQIWDIETGQPYGQPLQGHTDSVCSVAFSPNGKTIASGSADKSVRIWDAETGKPQGQPLCRHTSLICSVAFSPNGKTIASGSADKSVQIWDAETGKPQGQPLQGHTSWVFSVAFSPDGKRIVSGSADDSVRIWDAETREPQEQPLHEFTRLVSLPSFSPIRNGLLPGSTDNNNPLLDLTLTADGWLCDSTSSLVLWLPPEYQSSLMFPHMQLLISQAHPASLNLKHFVHGNDWAKCYR
ncbi:hypothetical protein GYMLUDRAFT_150144, partial [Collybiopsis luxurians FD-317 M1]